MAIHATQPIAGRFGTFMPGDIIDSGLPPAVAEAWLAAGIAEERAEAAVEAAEEIAGEQPKPNPAAKPKPEKATAPKRETAAGRRMQTGEAPQKRFTEKAE